MKKGVAAAVVIAAIAFTAHGAKESHLPSHPYVWRIEWPECKDRGNPNCDRMPAITNPLILFDAETVGANE